MADLDFIRTGDFGWVLKVMMAMADIQVKELADICDVKMGTIYDLRGGFHEPSYDSLYSIVYAIERWRPGTIYMMKAAEEARKNYVQKIRISEKAGR